jgi:hypothetical protein
VGFAIFDKFRMPYFYILQTREIIRAKQNIFKIGKTSNFEKRLQNYDKGSKSLFVLRVRNHVDFEQQIKCIFEKRFIQRKDYGENFFEGNFKEILDEVTNYYLNFEKNLGTLETSGTVQQPIIKKYNTIDVTRESNKIQKKLNRFDASKIQEICDFQIFLNNNHTMAPHQDCFNCELSRFVRSHQNTSTRKSHEKIGDYLKFCINDIVRSALLQQNDESNNLMKLIINI